MLSLPDFVQQLAPWVFLAAAIVGIPAAIVGTAAVVRKWRHAPMSQIQFDDDWTVSTDSEKSSLTAVGRVAIVTQASGILLKDASCRVTWGKSAITLKPARFDRHQVRANTWVMEFTAEGVELPEDHSSIDVRIELEDGSKGRMKTDLTLEPQS